MLALAAPQLRHQDAVSGLLSSSSARARQSDHRWPLHHTPRPHAPEPQPPSQPPTRPQRAKSNPQLTAVHVPPPRPADPPQNQPAPAVASTSAPLVDQSQQPNIDIHSIPPSELLKLLASLLQQIASANDSLCASSPVSSAPPSPSSPHPTSHPPIWQTLTSASKTAFSTSTAPLSFHARNIPTISLEAYLLRILKYCPISNEVFISLLIYFDRMSKLSSEATGAVFAIDSYNVHRLVIAGITVASKFLSDVFYTNTRYAKVGGLPQAELNQLELQFLLLNNFNLLIRLDEMQKYAEQLIAYAQNRSQWTTPSLSDAQVVSPTSPVRQDSQIARHTTREPEADGDDEGERSEAGDGGETTDDEPTIRPSHSSASSETHSILTAASEDTDTESEHDEREGYMNS